MSQALTVARPYAQALFHHAEKHEQLTLWLNVCLVLATMARTKKFAVMVGDPSVEDTALLDFMRQLIVECVPEMEQAESALQHYLQLLLERERLLIMDDIYQLYLRLLADKEETRNVHVTSAFAMTESQKRKLEQALEKRFACRVQLAYAEDPKLIGGATVRSGSWVMDGSIQDKLANLGSLFKD